MQSKLLHGIEDGPLFGGGARTDARDGADLLLVGGQVHTDCKSKALVPFITTGGCHSDGAYVTLLQSEVPQIFPYPGAFQGGRTFFRLIENALNQASLPKLGICANLQAIGPFLGKWLDPSLPKGALPQKVDEGQLNSTQRTMSGEAMQGALVKSSQPSGDGLACGSLDALTDHPNPTAFLGHGTHHTWSDGGGVATGILE